MIAREKVVFERPVAEDEIDCDSGFLIIPTAMPKAPEPADTATDGQAIHDAAQEPYTVEGDSTQGIVTPPQTTKTGVNLRITGSRDQLFKAWPAIANLADKAGKASIQVSATSEQGFDQAWLRNAVYEPLEEADVLDENNPDSK